MDPGTENESSEVAVGNGAGILTADTGEICRELGRQLEDTGRVLTTLCQDSDPEFIRTGRDLKAVAKETATLTEALLQTAKLASGDGHQGPLTRADHLVQKVLKILTLDRENIERDLKQVHELVVQISDCTRINDAIDMISASFRAVRINIRIQCSAQLISEEIFRDVTDDIDLLSRTLSQITKQIKEHLAVAAKKLVSLERTVTRNLIETERVSHKAKGVITRAYGDIRQLVTGTQNMIREAGRRAEAIAGRIDEVVVSIQFHDSFSQRTSHILHAFADVAGLCPEGEQKVEPAALGTGYLILDLQHRQLTHLIHEINTVHLGISQAFSVIGAEVKGLNSMLMDNQFRAVGPEQFLRSLSLSLRESLLQLSALVTDGKVMLDQINAAAGETKGVAARLTEIMQDVSAMRDETRLQAVNTIIMASNLGHKGRTIQVLAKEISTLSDKTSELVTDVEVMQLAVSQKVDRLCQSWSQDASDAIGLEEEIGEVDGAFLALEKEMVLLSGQIDSVCGHVEGVHAGLLFIQHLREGLVRIADRVEEARNLLLPWQDQASSESSEMRQLVERYTMEQERLIHMFDRAEGKDAPQRDADIFF